MFPLIGMRRRSRLAEAIEAIATGLSADDLAEIEEALPAGSAAGERYARAQLAQLDSERES